MLRASALSLAALLLLHAGGAVGAPQPRSLVVRPNEAQQDWTVPRRHSALGVEFLNHEIYGGLSTQLLFGESFEEDALCDQARAVCTRDKCTHDNQFVAIRADAAARRRRRARRARRAA